MNNDGNNMENSNNGDTLDKSMTFINHLYDNVGYYDVYGNSVIIFTLITLFVFLVHSYCNIMQTKQSIADDWINQRCKPQNIPFAGFIIKPEGKTAFEYTGENFQHCVKNVLVNIAGYSFEPLQLMMNSLNDIFRMIAESIVNLQKSIIAIRQSISKFASDILKRILNITIPIQQMFISLIDAFQKIQGIMTAGLYTMLGTFVTLQSLMGSILDLIVKALIAMVILIIGLWVLPFTWPIAAVTTITFTAIAIPLAIIIHFMTEVLHIKPVSIPQLRCFDKNTVFIMHDFTEKTIECLQPGDILQNNVTIMTTIKVTSQDLLMYNLNGIIVSESHIVNYNNEWIPVREHPKAIIIQNYIEPYLYCLNTSTKTIVLNGITFTDWDEIYGDTLKTVLNNQNINVDKNINNILDNGLHKNTIINLLHSKKSISSINIGDILSTTGIVYGIVKLKKCQQVPKICSTEQPNDYLYHLLVSTDIFISGTKKYHDYNYNVDRFINSII